MRSAFAYTDALTGIGNRRHGLALLEAAMERQPGSLSVALLDLDHFKQINDQHGHAHGDEVLRDFAHRLSHAIRRDDTCARLGGEEFLLVLPDTLPTDAGHLLERLFQQLRDASLVPGGLDYRCSAGIAAWQDGDTLDLSAAPRRQRPLPSQVAGRGPMAAGTLTRRHDAGRGRDAGHPRNPATDPAQPPSRAHRPSAAIFGLHNAATTTTSMPETPCAQRSATL